MISMSIEAFFCKEDVKVYHTVHVLIFPLPTLSCQDSSSSSCLVICAISSFTSGFKRSFCLEKKNW